MIQLTDVPYVYEQHEQAPASNVAMAKYGLVRHSPQIHETRDKRQGHVMALVDGRVVTAYFQPMCTCGHHH